jgi:Zn-dependent protease
MDVMDANVHLGKIAGIRVGVHWSLLLIFWLVAWSLAGGQLPHAAPGHALGAYGIAALCAGVIFYACLLAHELAHSVVARHRNIDVEGILLWLLGGVSNLKGEPADPDSELRIAIAGLGYGFMALGLASVAAFGLGTNGVWLAAIGWFLVSASHSKARASVMAGNLAGWRVKDAMTPAPLTVPTWASLDRLVEEDVSYIDERAPHRQTEGDRHDHR